MKHGRVVDVRLLDRHPAAGKNTDPLDNHPFAVAEKRCNLLGRICGELAAPDKRDVMQIGAGFRILRFDAVESWRLLLYQKIGKRERRCSNHKTEGVQPFQHPAGNSCQFRFTARR